MNIINNLCNLCNSNINVIEKRRTILLYEYPNDFSLNLCEKCENTLNNTTIPNNITRKEFLDIIFILYHNVNFKICLRGKNDTFKIV